ncbi:MAG TPA: hypothetical protein VGP43_02515 [Chitinophagaceae bacterium]|nr:hypothetical protein [Chitinophagaceae bacterium]
MLKAIFTPVEIENLLKQKVAEIENEIIDRLIFIGETFVNNARNKTFDQNYIDAINSLAYAKGERRAIIEEATPGFKDHTQNLRSSIGYLILKNGEPVFNAFEGGSPEGKAIGLRIATEASKKFGHTKGIVLIVVAGMSYSSYVESKGYDVITGSSIIAENDLRKAIKEMEKKFR